MILASAQQRIGLAVVLVLTIGWVIYLISSSRRSYEPGRELVAAPNRRTYFEDEDLETSRLTKYLWWAFAMLAICAVGLPLYWLREPFRQEGAGFDRGATYFEEVEVERGRELYQTFPGDPPKPREPHFGCEGCHGPEGVGGVAVFTLSDPANPDATPIQVQWAAPALNTVMLRYRPEEVREILVYGRAGTPMPPWGIEGGGALNDQQIDNLISYLQHIAIDPEKAKAESLKQYGVDGAKLFEAFCARCHTERASISPLDGQPPPPPPGISGGGAFGPSLTAGATLRQFPTVESHIEWVAKTAEKGAQYGVRGQADGTMPHFENLLTPEQIAAVVAYERSL